MDWIAEALSAGLAATTFLVGFSSVRLRAERDRALARSDDALADLSKATVIDRALSDREVLAAADGLTDADRGDPIGRLTVVVTFVVAILMIFLGVVEGLTSGLPLSPDPTRWTGATFAALFFLVVDVGIAALGAWDYKWVEADLDKRMNDSVVFRASKAVKLHRSGSDLDALALADVVAERLPSWPWAHAFRSLVLNGLGRAAEARDAINRAVTLDPTNGWWLVARAEQSIEQGRPEDAASDLDSLSGPILESEPIRSLQAAALYALGRREEALVAFDEAVRLAPDDPERRFKRGQALLGADSPHSTLSAAIGFVDMLLDDGKRIALDAVARAGAVRLRDREAISAIADFDFVISKKPTEGVNYAWRAAAKYQSGDVDGAEDDFVKAAALGASASLVHRMRGTALAGSGHPVAGEKEYTSAIGLNDSAAAHYARAMIRMRLGNFGGSLEDFDAFLGQHPEDSDAMAHRAEALAAVGKTDDSDLSFKEAEATGDHLSHTYSVWLRSLLRQNRPSEAEAVLGQALSARLTSSERFYVLSIGGSVYAALKLYESALATFDEAESISPQTPEISYRRAMCLADMGDKPRALAALARAADQAWPMQFAALASRAALQRSSGQSELALADLDLAIQMESDDVQLRVSRGCLLMSMGRSDVAIPDLNTALEMSAKDVSALLHRVEARSNAGDMVGARSDLDQLSSLLPNDDPALNRTAADYWFANRDWAKAATHLRAALAQDENDPSLLASLAATYVNNAEFGEAEQIFALLARLSPDNLHPRAGLAVSVSLQGRSAEARRLLRALRKSDPVEIEKWVGRLVPDLLPDYEVFMSDWRASAIQRRRTGSVAAPQSRSKVNIAAST